MKLFVDLYEDNLSGAALGFSKHHIETILEPDILRKWKIFFVTSTKQADFILCDKWTVERYIKSYDNLILYQHLDNVVVLETPGLVDYYLNPRIVRILHRTKHLDTHLSFHTLSKIPADLNKKIVPFLGLLYSERCWPILRYKALLKLPKKFDVDLCARYEYGDTLVTRHRQAVADAASKLTYTKKISMVRNKKWYIPYLTYLERIAKAKIVISPWGKSEDSFRDYLAILLGTIVLKPNTNYIQTNPNIYQGQWYIPICPEGSDIQEKVKTVLDNWEYYNILRLNLRRNLLNLQTSRQYTSYFVQTFQNL